MGGYRYHFQPANNERELARLKRFSVNGFSHHRSGSLAENTAPALKFDRLNLVLGGEVDLKIDTIATQRIVAAKAVCGRFQSAEIAWMPVMLHQ